MGIKAALQPLNTRTGASSPGVSEIQRISIGGNLMSERQVILRSIVVVLQRTKVFFHPTVDHHLYNQCLECGRV